MDYRERLIDLGALRIFAAVAEADTLTAAARRLGITQSAVSQALRQLEDLLSVKLVDRGQRPHRLTPSGDQLRTHAERMLTEARRFNAVARQSAPEGLTKIRLGLIDSFASAAGARVVKRLSGTAAHLLLWSGLTPNLTKALLDRELDMVVTTDALDAVDGIERFPLLRDPLVLLVPDALADVAREGGPQALAERLPLVRYSRRSVLGIQVELSLRRLGVEPPYRFEFDGTDPLVSIVHAGFGWAITTLLCLLQTPHAMQGTVVMPLPRAPAARVLTLTARQGEFDDVPQRVAQICRGVFLEECLPEIRKRASWSSAETFMVP